MRTCFDVAPARLRGGLLVGHPLPVVLQLEEGVHGERDRAHVGEQLRENDLTSRKFANEFRLL